MKKVYYTSIVGIVILCLLNSPGYRPGKVSVRADMPIKEFKVLVKFREGVFSPGIYRHTLEDIHSWGIKSTFEDFGLSTMKAVFKNRYDNKGQLMKDLPPSNPHYLEGWQQVAFNSEKYAEQFIVRIKECPGVDQALVEEPFIIEPAIAPNDPEYLNDNQWHLNNPFNPASDIDADPAWDINRGRNDVVIAILDGGVDYNHPDMDPGNRSRVIAGIDTGDGDNDPLDDLPDNNPDSYAGHGTSVAGVVGAITDNGQQVSGVMWNCRIMPIKMVRSGGIRLPHIFDWDWSTSAFPSDVADAIDYAVNNGAHAINLSYSFPDLGWPINEVALRIPLLFQALDNAYQNNVVITASMGNHFGSDNDIRYPAGFHEQVIAVGATTTTRAKAGFSNTGPHISVAAPGVDIRTTARGGGVRTVSGTSFSAPLTAGVAGLIISQGKDRNFDLTNDDVRHILELTAADVFPAGFDNETGHGIINAHHALQLLDEPNVLYHYNSIGGTSTKTQTFKKWILLSGRWGLAAAMYFNVDQYKITKHITFDVPFCSPPQVWFRERQSKSLRFANPNSGLPFVNITNVTSTGLDLEYATYYVRYNGAGQEVNQWVPAAPASTNVAYTVVGNPNISDTAGSITGPGLVCNSNTAFSLSNVPPNSTLTWSTSSNLTYVSGQNTNSYIVKSVSSTTSGTGYVSVIVSNPAGCGSASRTKNIWVGLPGFSSPTVDGSTYYPGSCHGVCPGYHWAKLEVLGGSQFDMSWTLNPGGAVSWEWDPYDSEIVFEVVPYYTSFPFSFVGTVNNLCGPSQFTFCFMSGPNCQEGFGYSFSPNPSSDELVISKDDSNGTTGSSGETEVVLYNSAMEKVYSVVSTSAIIKVPVKEMREGNYFLHIISKEGIVQRQVVVKH